MILRSTPTGGSFIVWLAWSTPLLGMYGNTPSPGLDGGTLPPIGTGLGYPPSGLDEVLPPTTWMGVPPSPLPSGDRALATRRAVCLLKDFLVRKPFTLILYKFVNFILFAKKTWLRYTNEKPNILLRIWANVWRIMYSITISSDLCLFSYILYGALYTVLLSVVLLLACVCLTVWMTMKVHELRSWKGPLLLCICSWLTVWLLMAQVG